MGMDDVVRPNVGIDYMMLEENTVPQSVKDT